MNAIEITEMGTSNKSMVSLAGADEARTFTGYRKPADVAVLVVTYNSENDIPELLESLRKETIQQSIKVIVADNSPAPSDSLKLLASYRDVFSFSTGGNLGYAGAINAAIRRAGDAATYLVLNPDVRVAPGSIQAMRNRMSLAGAGVVVPLLLEEDGSVYPSLRREPSVFRALGDALVGRRIPGRPNWLSETDYAKASYRHSHRVEWATGAALLIRADMAHCIGDWDERYFLYSEETDFMRRARSVGEEVWFEPKARMTHSRGGSGNSFALDALMAINRVRYVRKFHSRAYAHVFRGAIILAALLRAPKAGGLVVLSTLMQERLWERLPQATNPPRVTNAAEAFPPGAVIIPAHNEEAVIGRTLRALTAAIACGSVEVIVACNGCTDGTSAVARTFPGVQVVDIVEASKTAALMAGDKAATKWPRVYLDADIELPLAALQRTLEALSAEGGPLAARPAYIYDTEEASIMVRAFYRARNRLPHASKSLWGAGVYGLSQQGHSRIGGLPAIIADDLYVDELFCADEKEILRCQPVTVRTPRSVSALLATLERVYRGNAQLQNNGNAHTARTLQELLSSVLGPSSAFDASVYSAFVLIARLRGLKGRPSDRWERDDSSRADTSAHQTRRSRYLEQEG